MHTQHVEGARFDLSLPLSLSHPFIILTKVTKSTTTHNSSPGRKEMEENLEEESALSRLAVIHCCLIFPLLDRTIVEFLDNEEA